MIRLSDILTEKKTKLRSIIDDSSKEWKRLGLKKDQFHPNIFAKGFPSDKRYALILINKNGHVGVYSTNRDIKTAEANRKFWSVEYAYPDEVKSWEILPMKTIEI